MKGSDILIECLKKENVDVIFGYPGGSVLPLFDSLYDAPMRFILTRHEQAAAHAADGYARATGKVGVCIATSGPGATNLTTGLATAFMDSVPLVAITGQVKTKAGWKERTYRMFVRDLDLDPQLELSVIQEELERRGLWKSVRLNYGAIGAGRLTDFVTVVDNLLARDPWILVKNK